MNDYYKNCAFPKPEKKKKDKEKVSEETYNIVFNACKGRCVLMDENCKGWLELHHIDGRGPGLTGNPLNCVMLCDYHHDMVVHGNLKKYRPILRKISEDIYGSI